MQETAMKGIEAADAEMHNEIHNSTPEERKVRFVNTDKIINDTVSAADEAAGISVHETRKPTRPRPPRLSTFEKNGERVYSLYSPSHGRAEDQAPQFHPRHLTSPIGPHLSTQEKNGDRKYSSYHPNIPIEDANIEAQRIAFLRQTEPQAPRLTTLEKYGDRIYSSTCTSSDDEMSHQYPNLMSHRDPNHVTMPVAPRLVTLEKHGDRVYSSYNPHSDDYSAANEHYESTKLTYAKRTKPRAPKLATLEKHGERLYSSYSNESAPAALSEASNYRVDPIPSSMRHNKTTIQSPFKLRSSSRSRARSSSPYRSSLEMEQSHEFKALPVPKFSYRSPRNDRQEKKYTKPVPFNLRSTQRAASPARSYHSYEQSHSDDSERHNFVARRMPNLAYRSPRPREKHYTVPQPFHLHTDGRISERTTGSEHHESHRFIARPMPDFTYRPPINQSEQAHHPTRPVGFKLGYDRDRELNPIPNMAHRYPPKPSARESTEPHDFMFAHGREHQYSDAWNQYPNDDLNFRSSNDMRSYDGAFSRDTGSIHYSDDQVIHYIETPEGVNVDFEYKSHSGPTMQEHTEFVQTRDHHGEGNTIHQEHNLSWGRYVDMHASEVELDKLTDLGADQLNTLRTVKEQPTDFPVVKDDKGKKSQNILDLSEKDHTPTKDVSNQDNKSDDQEGETSSKSKEEMESNAMKSSSEEKALPNHETESEDQDDEMSSKSKEVMESNAMKESTVLTDEDIKDNFNAFTDMISEDALSSSFEKDEVEGEEKTSPNHETESEDQDDEMSSKSKEVMESDAMKGLTVLTDEGKTDNFNVLIDMIKEWETESSPSKTENKEGEVKVMSQRSEISLNQQTEISLPVDEVHQEKEEGGTWGNEDKVENIEGQENEDTNYKARDPVEDAESGDTSKFRQGWHRAPDSFDPMSPEHIKRLSPQRFPVEDAESGFTSSFRQGWHRTLKNRDLTTEAREMLEQENLRQREHDMLETKEQTYLLSSPKMERKKSKSRSLFKRNKKYAQMKKSSWKKKFSRKHKSAKSDVKEESREFASVTNASPKDEMSTDDVFRKSSNHTYKSADSDPQEGLREVSGAIVPSPLAMMPKEDSLRLLIQSESFEGEESAHTWWCCDESPLNVMFLSQDSRDDE